MDTSNNSDSFYKTTTKIISYYKTTPFVTIDSPVECYKLKVVAGVFIIAFVSSVYLNSSIIWIFLKTKKLNVSINFFLFSLIVYNLIGTILEFPIVIMNNFNCRYEFLS